MKNPLSRLANAILKSKKPRKPAAKPPVDYSVFFRAAPFDSKSLKGAFIYPTWIPSHGDNMFKAIDNGEGFLLPVELFIGADDQKVRSKITKLFRQRPLIGRRYLIKMLMPLRGVIQGVCVSMDWTPAMRAVVNVCKQLDIPTVLVPHEGVFASRDMYYTDTSNGANYPIADTILAWGNLHEDIFVERGYPEDRIEKVGAVKFDRYKNYKPTINRANFFASYGLNSSVPTVLFVAQPLDSQFDQRSAKQAQIKVISDLFDISDELGYQVIVRCPPSGDKVLTVELTKRIFSSKCLSYDEIPLYMSSPEDAVYFSDCVVSINSTMLFEATLAGTPSVISKYIEYTPMWENLGIPVAENKIELKSSIMDSIAKPVRNWTSEGEKWAKHCFSSCEFDGMAASRIRSYLASVRSGGVSIDKYDEINCLALHVPLNELNKYVPEMMEAKSVKVATNFDSTGSVDAFAKWGIGRTNSKDRQDKLVFVSGKPQYILEDGFLRSKNIGLSGESALSITVDTKTAYYDATMASDLEDAINSEYCIPEGDQIRAANCIAMINYCRLSKYNHAPDVAVNMGSRENKVLVVDQRFGDMSVIKGMASLSSFIDMLTSAISDNPDADIIVKLHPDSTIGSKQSYFGSPELAELLKHERVLVVRIQVNPHRLFDVCQKVYVVTSGLGFEAVSAGLEVHTFGMPFYAGWGFTNDALTCERRVKRRRAGDVFYFAYLEFSRYYSPTLKSKCEIEDVILFLSE